MAQTDTRPGFRLPWSSDRTETDAAAPNVEGDVAGSTDTSIEPVAGVDPAVGSGTEGDAVSESPTVDPVAASEAVAPPTPEPVAAPIRKPNKFLADLTKAMQTTAESARFETMERFTTEAKAASEHVHAQAAEETAELRRVADEDVAGIRDWSKGEIARIREETENRISGRKADLERELEIHAGTVEQRLERVTAFVAAFEGQMAAFYDRLFAEEDPTHFAAMAEQLPEPPSFDLADLDAAAGELAAQARIAAISAAEPVEATPVVGAIATPEPETHVPEEPVWEPADESAPSSIAATGEPSEARTRGNDAGAFAEAVDARNGERTADAVDFAAAEAEASMSDDGSEAVGEEIPVIADEVIAARLAGLVPEEGGGANTMMTSRVVVSGLVSVASIAGFKRHLARMGGAASVGVSSGPDGEFVFTVQHLPSLDLATEIVGLPGFQARITDQQDGTIAVAASDPESQD